MIEAARRLWQAVRAATGDDAYERYVAHWREQHRGDSAAPLDRRAFFHEEQRRKWEGVRRCC
ncbi:MAG TPA: YbdD/YjiX family protein [Gammaproteobacteria bacterium]|nr:YbdD/YjiX family protein [Gammaproteobacteria bacterium]